MHSPIVRLILTIIALYFSWNAYSDGNIQSALLYLLAVGLIIWGYFKNGTVYLAFNQIKNQNFDKAELLLNKVNSPENLKKQQQAYYHFTKGYIDLNKSDNNSSLNHFKKSIELGLRTENDKAVALLNIVSIELEQKNFEEAKSLLNEIQNLNYKDSLTPEIEKILRLIEAN